MATKGSIPFRNVTTARKMRHRQGLENWESDPVLGHSSAERLGGEGGKGGC